MVSDQSFDLPDGNHGKNPYENQETRKEQTKAAQQSPHIKDSRHEHAPTRRQKAAVQRGYDDYETLKPHADIYQNRNDEEYGYVVPNSF